MSKEEIDRIERSIDELFKLVREVSKSQAELAVAVARIEEQTKGQTKCPNPLLCTELNDRLHKVEEYATTLRLQRAEIAGGWRTLVSIGSAIVAVGSVIAIFWSGRKP